MVFIAIALWFVSIGLLQLNCEVKVVQEFSPDSLIQEALQIAATIEDAPSRSETLRQIADELMKAGRKEQAKGALKQALDAAVSIKEEWLRSQTLCDIATLMVKLGIKDQALATFKQAMESAKGIPREVERIWNQHDVTLKMAKVGLFDDAVKAAKEIKHVRVRSVTIYDIVTRAMIEAGAFEQALKVAKNIESPYWRLRALVNVAIGMAKTGQKDKAIRTLEQVLQPIRRLESKYDRDMVLREVALSMAKVGSFDRAMEIANNIKDAEYRAWTYGDIAAEISKTGEKQMAHIASIRALRTAMNIKDTNRRRMALSSTAFRLADAGFYDLALHAAKNAGKEPIVRVWIVENMAKGGKFEEALKTARAINDALLRLSALGTIVSEMARLGMKQQASQVVKEMLKIPKESIKDAISAVKVLHKTAEAMVGAEVKEQAKEVFNFAIQVARDIKPELWSSIYERANPQVVVSPLISSIASAGFIDWALQIAEEFPKANPSLPVHPDVFHNISLELAKVGQIERALKLARSISDSHYKAISLVTIARVLLHPKSKCDKMQRGQSR